MIARAKKGQCLCWDSRKAVGAGREERREGAHAAHLQGARKDRRRPSGAEAGGVAEREGKHGRWVAMWDRKNGGGRGVSADLLSIYDEKRLGPGSVEGRRLEWKPARSGAPAAGDRGEEKRGRQSVEGQTGTARGEAGSACTQGQYKGEGH